MEEQKNKLYVGNLSFSVNEEQLNNYFEENGIGVQTVTIIKEKYTDKSKGFGFVTVGSEEDVNKAIETLNSKEFEGRTLTVSKAKAKSREGRRDFSRQRRDSRGRGGNFGYNSRGPRNRY